nr:transglutaminase family protein [Afifella marina]
MPERPRRGKRSVVPIYTVTHLTTYRYRKRVGFGEHRMMFLPREGHDQHLLSSTLTITPEPVSLRWHDDALGNRVGVARFTGGRSTVLATSLVFESVIRVAHFRSHPAGINLDEEARFLPVSLSEEDKEDLRPFLVRRYPDPDGTLLRWAESFLDPSEPLPTFELLTAMIHAIRHDHAYVRRDHGIQDPAETLTLRSGTCRDFTELMIEALRALGLPARFVSGYLYVPARDSHDIHGGGATHAWVQVYLPGAGWIDIDPTNAILGNEGLIRIAVAREPSEVLPLSGSYLGMPDDDLGMEVMVKVAREDDG